MALPASLRALHVFQWGAEVSNATVTLTLAVQPTAGSDTITLGSVTYNWVTSASTTGDIAVGLNLAAAKTNFLAAIAGDAHNTKNPDVTAAAFSGNTSLITAVKVGTEGNGLASTASFTSGSNHFSATTLTGGGTPARGTLVPATSKIVLEDHDFDTKGSLIRPQLALGRIAAYPGNEQVIYREGAWSVPNGPMCLEQVPIWLSMITSNYVLTPGTPNVWVFTAPLSSDPAPFSRTLERRLSDGTNHDDTRFGFAMPEKLSFQAQQKKAFEFSANGFCRARQDGPITDLSTAPNKGFPSAITIPSAAGVSLYMDDNWASLGNTLISAQVYDVNPVFETGYTPITTSPGRTDLDFGTFLLDAAKWMVTGNMKALVSPSNFYSTERAKAEAATLRAVRIKIAVDASNYVYIDFMAKHEKDTFLKVANFNGSDVVDMKLLSSADDGAHHWAVTVATTTADLH